MSAVRVCALADLAPGTATRFDVGARAVAVIRIGDDVYAIGDTCSHAEISLSEGEVDGCTLECYMHGSRFDLRTGFPLELPATVPVPVYPVRLDGDSVFVDPDNPITTQEQ